LKLFEQDLEKIGVFECFLSYDNGIFDNEFHNTFISELKVDITELKLQIEEVEAVKLVSFSEFKEILKHIGSDNHFVASNKSYYEFVIHAIEKKLTSSQ